MTLLVINDGKIKSSYIQSLLWSVFAFMILVIKISENPEPHF